MTNLKDHQAGFTAVELLITLFVAAAFLIAGYQLFDVVIRDGGQARAESRAGNVAYDYLRRYSPSATNPCSAQTPLTNSAITADGLTDPRITVALTCPESSTPTLTKIDVTITYNNPTQTVKYATYVNGSSTQTADVTDGLIAWWKFNGDANASVGNVNGTVVNATPAQGQNGLANTAYAFNGTASQYISMNSTFGLGTGDFSISTWVYTATASNSGQFIKIGDVGYGIGMGNTTFDNTSPGTKLIALYEGIRWIPTTTDVGTGWHHIVMTVNSSGVPTLYRDGVSLGAFSGAGPSAPGAGPTTFGGRPGNNRNFNGRIDDTRIYNRILTPAEVTTIFNAGAK